MGRRRIARAAAATVAGLLVLASPTTAAPPDPGRPSAAQRFGIQQVPKDVATAAQAKSAVLSREKGANPYIGLLPDVRGTDYAYWRAVMDRASKQRAAGQAAQGKADVAAGRVPGPFLVDEEEAGRGGNDSPATAQFIPRFGSATGKRPAARILGTLVAGPPPGGFAPVPEDNGSIPLAGDTGLVAGQRRITFGYVGDGPHGSAGTGSGDFDFYKLTARAGQRLVVDTDTFSEHDTVVFLYDAAGVLLAVNDDDGESFASLLRFTIPRDGNYFVSVLGFGSFQEGPFDSASGDGIGSEGPYLVTFGLDAEDIDFYAVDLRPGDVVGASVTGSAGFLAPYDPGGRERGGSVFDASFIYPAASPLPGGGNAVIAHVADTRGRHTIAVASGTGDYDITLEVYRPGPESIGRNQAQRIFLDFDGARVNTGIFGGPGVRQLSPLRAFLGRWGLTAAHENALIDRIVRATTENLQRDFARSGVAVKILNSRDHPDPFGQPNVSRIIVGGTIEQSGIPTIGIAQSIDPGNYELEETALVLLDVLSDPPELHTAPNPSLNAYLRPGSDRIRFVGTAIGNVVSHEAGHYIGSFHVDQFNAILNLMDQGGNFPLLYGVGPDGVGGTNDDPDVDFGEDTYNPGEGFTGVEDTAANTKWGLSLSR